MTATNVSVSVTVFRSDVPSPPLGHGDGERFSEAPFVPFVHVGRRTRNSRIVRSKSSFLLVLRLSKETPYRPSGMHAKILL